MPSRGGIGFCYKLIAGADSAPPTSFAPDRVSWWTQFLARRWAAVHNLMREYPEAFSTNSPAANERNGHAHPFLIQDFTFRRDIPSPSLLLSCQVIKGRHQDPHTIYFDVYIRSDATPLQLLVWMIDHVKCPGPMHEALIDLIEDYPIPDIEDDQSLCSEFAAIEKSRIISRAAEIYTSRPEMMAPRYGLPYRPFIKPSLNGHAVVSIPWIPNTTNTF